MASKQFHMFLLLVTAIRRQLGSRSGRPTFNNQTGHVSYFPSTNLAEGDEVVFTCYGNVGDDTPGVLAWYYYFKNYMRHYEEKYQSGIGILNACGFNVTTSLKLTMSKELDKMVVRCTLHQTKYGEFGNGYIETGNIDVAYAPRIGILGTMAAKHVGDSVTLKCNADSNLPPVYFWILPNNNRSDGAELHLDNLKMEDAGLYICVAMNSFKGENHTAETSTSLEVLNFTNTVHGALTTNDLKTSQETSVPRSPGITTVYYVHNNTLKADGSTTLPVTSSLSSHGATTANHHMANSTLPTLAVSTTLPVMSILTSHVTTNGNHHIENTTLTTTGSITLPETSILSSHGITSANHHMDINRNVTWCMDCDNMIHLKYCDKVTRCSTDEVCYVQAFTRSGNIHAYRSGCMAKNKCQDHDENLHCQHCCDGDFCNTIGCGDSGLADIHQRGPLCFDCTHAGNEDTCQSVQMCLPGQVCKVEKYEWGSGFHYVMSCSDRSACASKRSLRGIQSRYVLVCSQCCQEDFCNMNCQQVPNFIG